MNYYIRKEISCLSLPVLEIIFFISYISSLVYQDYERWFLVVVLMKQNLTCQSTFHSSLNSLVNMLSYIYSRKCFSFIFAFLTILFIFYFYISRYINIYLQLLSELILALTCSPLKQQKHQSSSQLIYLWIMNLTVSLSYLSGIFLLVFY